MHRCDGDVAGNGAGASIFSFLPPHGRPQSLVGIITIPLSDSASRWRNAAARLHLDIQ